MRFLWAVSGAVGAKGLKMVKIGCILAVLLRLVDIALFL